MARAKVAGRPDTQPAAGFDRRSSCASLGVTEVWPKAAQAQAAGLFIGKTETEGRLPVKLADLLVAR